MFYIYILKSKQNGSYYIGSCKNLEIRLSMHNKGLVKSTKRYIPWVLIYNESFKELKGSRLRELQIKSWKNRKAIEKLYKSRILENKGGPLA